MQNDVLCDRTTKSDFFYKHFFIYNPKFCINQAIKVTKMTFLTFLIC